MGRVRAGRRGIEAMRCGRCGRRVRHPRAARLPDGRLAFDWCARCLADAHRRALGLPPLDPGYVRLLLARLASARRSRPEPRRPRPGPPPTRGDDDDRAGALRGLAMLLVLWGAGLETIGAGGWLGFGPVDDGFGPPRGGRLQVFSIAGGLLAILGAWVGLASVPKGSRRRVFARATEVAAIAMGGAVLGFGILFHDPRRDPWVVAGLAVALATARLARLASGPAPSSRPVPLEPG